MEGNIKKVSWLRDTFNFQECKRAGKITYKITGFR